MKKFEQIRTWAKEHTNELLILGGCLTGAAVAGAYIGAEHKRERQETRRYFNMLGRMHGLEMELMLDRIADSKAA